MSRHTADTVDNFVWSMAVGNRIILRRLAYADLTSHSLLNPSTGPEMARHRVTARRKLESRLADLVDGDPTCAGCGTWLDGGVVDGICDVCRRDPGLDGSE